MPKFFNKTLIALRANLLGVMLALLALTALAGWLLFKPAALGAKPQDVAYVLSQEISEITGLVAQKDQLDFLKIARPESEFPRYVFALKGEKKVHVVRVPQLTHIGLEREVLLKNALPYSIADDNYLAAHGSDLGFEDYGTFASLAGSFLLKNFGLFVILALLPFMAKGMLPGMSNKFSVMKPGDLKGSMDDLVGMQDIKDEVLHLESMLTDRAQYKAHNIDKPFNVMLTGPAGTGKTKLAGYLAKKLDIPLIQYSASSLETGMVGGGSRTLNAIYDKACRTGRCIIFLDEAQGLFMPRGRSEKKYDDDTPNTLLALLDGVKSEKGADVIWIVASNFDDNRMAMDEAMLRRFAVKIGFRMPNKRERAELLQVFLDRKAKDCIDWQHLDLDQVAEITANMAPALIESMVDRASMIAIQDKAQITTAVLFRAFERGAIGLTDRAATADKDKERERVAIHELGHFFMQIDPLMRQGLSLEEVKQKASLLKISTESVSKMGALGYVLSSAEEVGLHTLVELEEQVCGLYGGVAAEELFYGNRGISIGSQNDIEKATRILQLMVGRLSMYSRAKIDYSQLQSKGVDEKALANIEAKSAELYEHTLATMQTYRERIFSLKDVLMARYVLTKDEVFEYLQQEQARQAHLSHPSHPAHPAPQAAALALAAA